MFTRLSERSFVAQQFTHVVSDVDGTLVLQDEMRLAKDVLDALKRTVPLSLSSGRPPKDLNPLIEQVPKGAHFAGGASIVILPSKEPEVLFPIPEERIHEMIEFAHGNNLEGIHFLRGLEWRTDRGTMGEPIPLISLQIGSDKAEVIKLQNDLSQRYPDLSSVMTCDKAKWYIHVSHHLADKASALRVLEKRYGYLKGAALTFGDGFNDLPLFKEGGFAVLVQGRHHEELSDFADALTSPPDENGVVDALETLGLLSRRK